MTDYIQVMTTTDTQATAQAIASALVEKRLAACVQIVGPITSTYWWQDKIETSQEWLCIIKSAQDLYQVLEKAILKIHPYDVPEILAVPVTAGHEDYLRWLNNEIEQPGPK
ncbi:MAG: divalent-cation tolerance protein CutA [Chloroflexi bacterium]|nr:divalent-cation tolerance protein CutA [Chloroflexota bacterium]